MDGTVQRARGGGGAAEFQQLIQEGIRVAAQTAPRVGIARSLQAARALLLTGVELAQQFQERGMLSGAADG